MLRSAETLAYWPVCWEQGCAGSASLNKSHGQPGACTIHKLLTKAFRLQPAGIWHDVQV